MRRLLIANRGEIAVRIARAAMDLGIHTVAVYSEDDANGLHLRIADEAVALNGRGVPAYLDIEGVVGRAVDADCDALHPGYGFLAENAAFAAACAEAGITFVGPRPEVLELFGDKGRARAASTGADVPVLRGTDRPTTVEETQEFFAGLGQGKAMIIKALAGGGGRGTRIVASADEIEQAYERCRSEAERAFGNGGLYVEELIPRARHIEVQLLGDEHGGLIDFGERECSAQRRHQKVVETAPAPNLAATLRAAIIDAALRLGRSTRYNSLGTFEFLVDADEFLVDADKFLVEGAATPATAAARPPRQAAASRLSRRTPACRSSTRSPKRSPVSTWSRLNCESRTARRLPISGSERRNPSVRAASRSRRGSTWRPWTPRAPCAPPPAYSSPTNRRADRECGSTAAATPATRRTLPSTPCWRR